MTSTTDTQGGQSARLRRSEEALARATIRLAAAAGGLDNVSVDAIAIEAEMARRTFFNRFATKEDALLWPLRQVSHRLFTAFRERPEDDDVWDALEAATLVALATDVGEVRLAARADRVIEMSPSLLGSELLGADAAGHFAEIVRRTGVDPDRTPLPHLIGTASYGILRIAMKLWQTTGVPLPDTVAAGFDALRRGFGTI